MTSDAVVDGRKRERAKMVARKARQAAIDKTMVSGEDVVPARLSRKILDVARAQQREAGVDDASGPRLRGRGAGAAAALAAAGLGGSGSAASRALAASDLAVGGLVELDDDLEDDDDDGMDEDGISAAGVTSGDGGEFAIGGESGELALDPTGQYVVHSSSTEDVALFNRLLASQAAGTTSLSTAVASKLDEAESAAKVAAGRAGDAALGAAAGRAGSVGGASAMASMGFSPKVIKVFTDVATFLSRYKAGKLPKVMKILPTMAGWDELLGLTAPDGWTPHAFFAVTRIFVSNLNDVRAQRFLNLYLLPAVRNDIQSNGNLNYHLYQALRKALYKPAAWYRGVLLPLARSGDCTLREAAIVSSVLTTKRVPQLQSAAAIFVLATMPYSPAVSVFLRVMLSKRYTLTLRVIEALVAHFCGFVRVPGPLPVLWHQALLVFAQRYGPSTTQAQRDALKPVLATHVHRAITAEVHTALFAASPKRAPAAMAGSTGAYGQPAVSAPGPVKGAGSAGGPSSSSSTAASASAASQRGALPPTHGVEDADEDEDM